MSKKILMVAYCSLILATSFGQYTTDKVVGQKNAAAVDSMKQVSYPYMLPIWGEKVVQKGFNLPKSAGLSAQYLGQNSDIVINNLLVGFNHGPMHNLDEIIRFNNAKSRSNGLSIRPDIWLFPFLNVYGVFAKSALSTEVDFGVWLPDSSGWNNVLNYKTKAEFNATTMGFGITPTMGVGGYFFALDMNFTWSDIDELDEPAFAFVFGPRVGKNFQLKKPESNVALWVGGFRLKLASETSGSLGASALFPVEEWGVKIDEGYIKLTESQQKVDAWWTGLSPAEQQNPINKAKYETANSVLTRYAGLLDGASQLVDNASNSSVQYSLQKKPKDMWNFLIGSQYQINKSWMIRAEVGILGSRTQIIAGIQYRFDL